MASHARVVNISKNCELKLSQARRFVEDGVCAWVEVGVSVRTLTLAERLTRRSELARVSEPFPASELPGLVTVGIADIRHERAMAWQGTRFALEAR